MIYYEWIFFHFAKWPEWVLGENICPSTAHQDPPRGKVGRTFHCEPEPFSWYCQKAKISKKVYEIVQSYDKYSFCPEPHETVLQKNLKKKKYQCSLFPGVENLEKSRSGKKLRGKWLLGGWLHLSPAIFPSCRFPHYLFYLTYIYIENLIMEWMINWWN